MKIIYFICYYGDTIQDFDLKALKEISKEFNLDDFGSKKGKKKIKTEEKEERNQEEEQDDD